MSKIAVYFPGIGYHCDKPLLYYGRDIARELGYENDRKINYIFHGGNIRGSHEKMQEAYEALFSQAEEELSDIVWNNYDHILFVSKSIGTMIAASYAKKYGLEQVKHILYTPLVQTFSYEPKNAVGFIGDADPWSDVNEIVRLSQKGNIPLTVYEGCNHSLECADTLKNLEILKDVMQKTKQYCISKK